MMTRQERAALVASGGRGGPTALFRSLPLARPCHYEGAIVSFCPSCPASAEGKHVRSCDLHDACTRTAQDGPVRGCDRCPDYLPHDADPRVIAADELARNLPPYPEGRFKGRGVVIVGGGPYWACAYVTARMLRHVGCTLPAQVWYLGERERDDRYTAALKPYGVEVVDILGHPMAGTARNLSGHPGQPAFNCKSFAALHSPYEEVLLLDADSYPCADPTVLFDEPRYRQSGGIFWPDGPQTARWTNWSAWGVPSQPPGCGWEVGQYLVHKRSAWGPVHLARFYDDHGDHFYTGGPPFGHGDTGSWRVAWAKFRRSPTFFVTRVRWDHVAFVQPGPDGVTPWFVHRCRSKFRLAPHGFVSTPQSDFNARYGLPGEGAAFGYLAELQALLS